MIDSIINTDSVILVKSKWENNLFSKFRLPEKRVSFLPFARESIWWNKLTGRLNDLYAMCLKSLYIENGFGDAINEIIELDQNDQLYLEKLAQPRFKPRVFDLIDEYFSFWRQIFYHMSK